MSSPASSGMMSPITIGLVILVVMLASVIAYLYLSTPDTVAEPVYDKETCSEFITPPCTYDAKTCAAYKTTCDSNVKPASIATCSALGYSPTVAAASPITVTSKYCSDLSSNIANYASNVAIHYTNNPLWKKVLGSSSTFYTTTSAPASYTTDAIKSWVASTTNKTEATKYTTLAMSPIDSTDYFAASQMSTIYDRMNEILGMTTLDKTTLSSKFVKNNEMWIHSVTDDAGNTWSHLDPTQVEKAVIDGLKTLPPSDYVKYC